jgi:protein-disulfide isomerase
MKNLLLNLSLFLVVPLVSFGDATPAGNPVAVVAGQPISEQELLDALGPQQLMQLRTQEYEVKNKALESVIRHRIVEIEAKRRNISPEKLIEQEVDAKVADPTEGEIEAYFLGQNRTGVRLEDVKEQYRNALKQFKLVKARQAFADSLRANIEVAVLLRPPSIDIAFDPARVKGDPNAPVTIVEFSDYQCPYCKKTESVLSSLLAKYQGRVKLAYMDFPLREIHPRAESAAKASRCAGEQGKFWEFHDSLFADTAKLDDADLIARAKTLGLREEPFRACLASGKFKASVDADREAGTKAGIGGTPGFFINGVFLNGAQSQAEFEKVIDSQLSFIDHRSVPPRLPKD